VITEKQGILRWGISPEGVSPEAISQNN